MRLVESTWTEVRATLDESARSVAIVPVGAVEAHGPHLALSTDVVIADAMAEAAGERLMAQGWTALILPALDYTPAPFAAEFVGTISIRSETMTALLEDIASAIAGWGVEVLAIANAHLDPTHLGALYAARDRIHEQTSLRCVFPDVTRRRWASRLGEEFLSGACHAGRYETSIVLAADPTRVRDERDGLVANPASLSVAIRAGQTTFLEAGGPSAYFGDPAAASATEGAGWIAELGDILATAIDDPQNR
ncbi:MAG: creatininase family protein [Acidobacteriota bacterium]